MRWQFTPFILYTHLKNLHLIQFEQRLVRFYDVMTIAEVTYPAFIQ